MLLLLLLPIWILLWWYQLATYSLMLGSSHIWSVIRILLVIKTLTRTIIYIILRVLALVLIVLLLNRVRTMWVLILHLHMLLWIILTLRWSVLRKWVVLFTDNIIIEKNVSYMSLVSLSLILQVLFIFLILSRNLTCSIWDLPILPI